MNSIITSCFFDRSPPAFLRLGKQTDLFPVDVAQICYKANIRVKSFNMRELAYRAGFEGDPNLCRGAVIVKDGDMAILYRDSDTVTGRRFTIAHLLGHLCQHIEKAQQSDAVWSHMDILPASDEEEERKANLFARQLLLPPHSVRRLLHDADSVGAKEVYDLSQKFMVTEEVVRDRMKDLYIQFKF